jgi:signal transduction histidine kinase
LRKSTAGSLNEKNARYVTMIVEAAHRMGSLIDDLLAFSRISRAEAHNAPISLDQLVQEAIAEVRHFMRLARAICVAPSCCRESGSPQMVKGWITILGKLELCI